METKKGDNVSGMRDRIIKEAIESLQNEGLRFSVDMLAERLCVSKKTIYKYFSTKEALAVAMYEQYYAGAAQKAVILMQENGADLYWKLLSLYFESKKMTRDEIFNKYKLNQVIYDYAAEQNDTLWRIMASAFQNNQTESDRAVLKLIVDGSFEKLYALQKEPDSVIERLVALL